MEELNQQEQIINLGKLFVKELQLEPGVDTFSKWIAHYLAEKMKSAEKAVGKEKDSINKECFDLILKLWKHRSYVTYSNRPFYKFEPIIEFLSKLNHDNEEPIFHKSIPESQLKELEKENFDYDSLKDWINVALEIDLTAKIWIEYTLKQAAILAKDEKTREWIENTINLPESADSLIINKLIDLNINFEKNEDDVLKKYSIEILKDGISRLKKFEKFNKILLESYMSELNKLQKDNT